jgi:uncharacterized caspase-like protein
MLRYLLLGIAALSFAPVGLAEPPAKKVAVLVGGDKYDSARLEALQFAGRDAIVLGLELENLGFTTTVLTTDMKEERQPTKKKIEAALKQAGQGLTKNDVLLFHFSGQGMQFDDGEVYLCPRDCKPFKDEAKTMLAVSDVLRSIERIGAGNSFVLVDACRDDHDRTRGVEKPMFPIASGVGILFGCAKNEKAYEVSSHKHGLFTHAIVTGLRGEAKDRNGKITWDSLSAYVRETVPVAADKLTKGGTQRPQLIANLVGPSFVFAPAK